MFKKSVMPIALVAAILLVTAGILFQAQSAQASTETFTVSETSSCLICHEDRYYQHDTGNHYCLTEAASRCVDCHSGNPEAFTKETSHVGLIIYPILNGDISRCENCHEQDAQAHVDAFSELAGFSKTVFVAEQIRPALIAQTALPAGGMLDKKTAIGIAVITTVIAGLFMFCFLLNKSCH